MTQDIITIGQTKSIRECAVGAICRAGSECFVPCDITFWTDRDGSPIGNPIPLIRTHLKRKLEVDGFPDVTLLSSPTFTIIKDPFTGADRICGHRIPSVRFPSWMRCLTCGRLHRLPWVVHEQKSGQKVDSVEELLCQSGHCKGKLEFVTWVLISDEGYLDDIPWPFLAHRDSEGNGCFDREHLHLNRNRLGQLEIRCRRCGAPPVKLGGIRSKTFFAKLPEMRKQPWRLERVSVEGMENPPVAVKVTDVRVHLPKVISALDIPPESRIDDNDIRARISQLDGWHFLKPFEKIDRNQCRRLIKSTARLLGISRDALHDALDDLENGWPGFHTDAPTGMDMDEMLKAEYNALCTRYDDFKEHERFITDHQKGGWETLLEKCRRQGHFSRRYLSYAGLINQLVIVKRIREVQVFCGFRRHHADDDASQKLISPSMGQPTDWLPACELYGEGLFISLNEALLTPWENKTSVQARAATVSKRAKNSFLQGMLPPVSPRLILLHTMAHLIIKQLEFNAGYPASSIREKIFASHKADDPMSGILIYVAVPNKMGSLGGLAEHGKPEKFLKLWLKAMENASHCSFDPICAEHEGQGPDQLNRAACHGCTLLPEVSCIYNNCLLDRQFLMGSGDQGNVLGILPFMETHPDGDDT